MRRATNQAKYDRYKNSHAREKNKIKHIEKHLKKHPNDKKSLGEIDRLKGLMKK